LLALHLSTLNVAMQSTQDSPWAAQAAVMILVTVLMFSLMRKAVMHSGSAAVRATTALAGAVSPKGSAGATTGLATAGQFGQRSLNTVARATQFAGNATAATGVIAGGAVVGGTSYAMTVGSGSVMPTGTALAGGAVAAGGSAAVRGAVAAGQVAGPYVAQAWVMNRAAGGAARRQLDAQPQRVPVPA